MGLFKKRFYLREACSPTYYNLSKYLQARGWQPSGLTPTKAAFSEANFDFHAKAAETLEYKHLLAKLVADCCREAAPRTYPINDDTWPSVLTAMAEEGSAPPWILKPSLLNNGQHILIFETLAALQTHFASAHRLGGEHVLQEYLVNPLLLRDDRKFSMRQFVVLTNDLGAYVYQEGYCNVAKTPYSPNNFSNLSPHLTNEHLSHEVVNVIQIPSSRFDFYQASYEQMKQLLIPLLQGLNTRYPEAFEKGNQRRLAIFGFDFMLDAQKRLWLLEANHGPCFPTDPNHPLQAYLYQDFWQAFIDDFILAAPSGRFERLMLPP